MVSRRGNRQHRGGNPTVRQMIRGAQSRDSGKKLVPALRPPQIVRLPWNSFTFSATYSTDSASEITVSIGSIRGQINSIMGLVGAPGTISLKVNSAYGWNTAAGSLAQPSLQGLFWELRTDSGGSYSVRSEQYDHGTLNVPARCGYLWPLSDRKEVHTSANDNHVVAKFTVPSGALPNGNITVRVNVLWNSAANPALLNVSDPAQPLPVDIDALQGMSRLRLDLQPCKEDDTPPTTTERPSTHPPETRQSTSCTSKVRQG